MSKYKDDLKKMLATRVVYGDRALSIGAQFDDRKYFNKADFKEWQTLDTDPEFKPDIEWNINRSITDEENEFMFHDLINSFDYIFGLNLWEYIYDPITAHKNIHALLKTGGFYIGSYVFVYGKHNPAGTDYLRYTDDGIRKIMTMAHFNDIRIEEIKGGDLLTTFYDTEGMRIRKDVDHSVVGYLVTAKK